MKTKIFILTFFLITMTAMGITAEDNTTQLAQVDASGLSTALGSGVTGAGMQAKVSLDLRAIDIIDALKFLALKARLNIVTTKNVTGRITLMVENVQVEDIFDIILRSNELAYMKQGNIYNVMTEAEYKLLFGKSFADIRQVKTFRLNYAIPDQAFTLFDTLKSSIGRVLVEPDSGTALIMDTPDSIKKIEDALKTMEEKNLVKVFKLQYARAKDVEEQLKLRLDSLNVGSIRADERSNMVIVQTLPQRMPEIEVLITALDTKTKEVMIDTKIVKVKLIDTLDSGFEWEGLHNIGQQYGMSYLGTTPFSSVTSGDPDDWRSRLDTVNAVEGVGSYPFSGTSTAITGSQARTIGEAMHVGAIDSKRDLDFMIKYLKTIGNTQLLSNPKLAVTNNQEARIHVGEKQAYVTSTTTTGQTTTTVSEEVTFVDIGIQLALTPTINDDGYITLKVKPEISSVSSTLTTPSGNKIPIIDTSLAETTVLVKDGTTIIIGGLRREEETLVSEETPILGKIPVLGFFFSSKKKVKSRTELLIMITPTIVEGDKLTTGDERAFGTAPGKEYENYDSFTKESDYPDIKERPEEKIKAYKEYTNFLDNSQNNDRENE
ncbi:MAG: secretin N-terminal domain-containing protein [Candidatus Omnitrophota bacterium]